MVSVDYLPRVSGIATLTHEQAVGLQRLGHEVRVLTTELTEEAVIDALDVQRVSVAAKPVFRLESLRKALSRSLDAFRPDFIWCTNYRGFGLPVLVEARRRRIPYGIYLHGTELQTEAQGWARRRILTKVLTSASCIVTNSQNSAAICQRLYNSNPVVITPGVHQPDIDRAAAEAIRATWLGCQPHVIVPLVLVSACRLAGGKGLSETLEAINELPADILARLTYVIMGSGPEETALREKARQLNLSARVIFTGPVANNKVATHLAAADIYIQPSQPAGPFLESFGISYLEAQAAGLPCIATSWGGIPEAVRDGETGILVGPGSISQIQRAIIRLTSDEILRTRMGAAAIRWAAQNSWDRHLAQLNETICIAAGCLPPSVPSPAVLNLTR